MQRKFRQLSLQWKILKNCDALLYARLACMLQRTTLVCDLISPASLLSVIVSWSKKWATVYWLPCCPCTTHTSQTWVSSKSQTWVSKTPNLFLKFSPILDLFCFALIGALSMSTCYNFSLHSKISNLCIQRFQRFFPLNLYDSPPLHLLRKDGSCLIGQGKCLWAPCQSVTLHCLTH